ncbi:15807_t:CDS:2, partial [Gigaspora rosea]
VKDEDDETFSLGRARGNDEEGYLLNKDKVICVEFLGSSLDICIWFST